MTNENKDTVAALAGPHFARLEEEFGRRLSPNERLIWLDGLHVGVEIWQKDLRRQVAELVAVDNDMEKMHDRWAERLRQQQEREGADGDD